MTELFYYDITTEDCGLTLCRSQRNVFIDIKVTAFELVIRGVGVSKAIHVGLCV